MKVKGFIIEDDQKRELVLTCEPFLGRSRRVFLLRGWQRRRLVPLHYTERELRRVVGGVLVTLHDLFENLPRFYDNADHARAHTESAATLPLRKRPALRKVHRGGCGAIRAEHP